MTRYRNYASLAQRTPTFDINLLSTKEYFSFIQCICEILSHFEVLKVEGKEQARVKEVTHISMICYVANQAGTNNNHVLLHDSLAHILSPRLARKACSPAWQVHTAEDELPQGWMLLALQTDRQVCQEAIHFPKA